MSWIQPPLRFFAFMEEKKQTTVVCFGRIKNTVTENLLGDNSFPRIGDFSPRADMIHLASKKEHLLIDFLVYGGEK